MGKAWHRTSSHRFGEVRWRGARPRAREALDLRQAREATRGVGWDFCAKKRTLRLLPNSVSIPTRTRGGGVVLCWLGRFRAGWGCWEPEYVLLFGEAGHLLIVQGRVWQRRGSVLALRAGVGSGNLWAGRPKKGGRTFACPGVLRHSRIGHGPRSGNRSNQCGFPSHVFVSFP
jgi:hypothetical protein